MIQLTQDQKNTLNQCSRTAIETAFGNLWNYFSIGDWLDASNRYRRNTIASLEADEANSNIVVSHLSEYVAASATLHCADGWGFLGRALECHAIGDCDVSRHIAYYAELRAAMSLLAAEGIGIFSRKHFVIKDYGNYQSIPDYRWQNSHGQWKRRGLGTHEIIWPALEYWAGLNHCKDLLAQIIFPSDIPLETWLSYFMGGSGLQQAIGMEWLTSWGLDLQRLGQDHVARNEASYRPCRLNPKVILLPLDSSKFIRDFWSVYNPSGISRAEKLDRHLLRLSLEKTFLGLTGSSAQSNLPAFEHEVRQMLKQVFTSTQIREEWKGFLTRNVERDDLPIITEANTNSPPENPRHHIQVIARAALLLRIATGACSRLLEKNQITRTDLEFWWKPLILDRGILDQHDSLNELIELWDDISSALEGAEGWESANASNCPQYFDWRYSQGNVISKLGECELICLWGLGL